MFVCRLVSYRAFLHLVAEALGGDHSDLITDTLVATLWFSIFPPLHVNCAGALPLEVQSQAGVEALNDDLGGLLHGLSSDATHFGGFGRRFWESVVWLVGLTMLKMEVRQSLCK